MLGIKRRRLVFVMLFMIVFFSVFYIVYSSYAKADCGDAAVIKSYEEVLIKEGDTLSSIAKEYTKKYSHFTESEYLYRIMDFNNMNSERINSGKYILLPNYI